MLTSLKIEKQTDSNGKNSMLDVQTAVFSLSLHGTRRGVMPTNKIF